MNTKNTALKIAGCVFLFISFAHTLRLVFRVPIIIGGAEFPYFLSILGLAGPLVLAVWMFKASQ